MIRQNRTFSPGAHTLQDGRIAQLRAVQPDDVDRLIGLFNRLSPESVYFRFLEPRKTLPRSQAEVFAKVDYEHQMAIVATLPEGDDEVIIAVARYAWLDPVSDRIAEAAIVVEDACQNQGLGTELLRLLVDFASKHGVRAFRAAVHQSNQRILDFIHHSGLPATKRLQAGVWDIIVELEPPVEA
jgi:acetyltransferase